MKRMHIASLAAVLIVACTAAFAAAEPQPPQVGSFTEADVAAVRAQFAEYLWTPGMDCGRDDQVLAEMEQIARGAARTANRPLAPDANANGDNDATHYARGATMIIHVFINHTGGTWEVAERNAAGVKSRDAKDFYISHRPAGANLLFDYEGSPQYLYYTANLAYSIATDGMSWAITEDALADIGFTDGDGDGARVDEATYFIQDLYNYDNVIFVFQPADRTGRAFASYGFARVVQYTDDVFSVWRHEWGHSFGACDEYVESGQCNGGIDCNSCQSTYLPAVINNGNCDLVGCPTDVSCVMRNNVDAICSYTDDHWGWDQVGSGTWMQRRLVGGGFTPIYEATSGQWWTWTSTAGGFGYHQLWDTWAVVGVRPPAGTDYDIRVYNDNNHDHQLASSAFGGSSVDFVVTDYNHSQRGIEHWQMSLFSGAQNTYRTQYESGTSTLYPDGVARAGSWGTNDIVRVWEVPLFGGETVSFVLDVTSGTPDLSMALYKSNGSEYSIGRSGYVIQANSAGAGGTEGFTYDVPEDDVYGLVVWSNSDGDAGNFTIQIGPTPFLLAEETPFYSGFDLRLFQYDPNSSYWAFVGTRPDPGIDVDLRLFDNSTYTTQLAEATVYGPGLMEWFMVDYNHASTAIDYLRVNRVTDPGLHRTMWEQDPEFAPQVGVSTSFASPTLGKVWDVFLSGGQQYYFRSYQGAGFDNAMYLYRSTGSGNAYQPRQDFVTFSNFADTELREDFTYTAPASDYYGLLMPVMTESSGNAAIWWGPSFTLADDAAVSRSDDVVFSSANVPAGYWNVFGVRSSNNLDANINLYDDNNYTAPWLATDQFAPVNSLRYVVGDFNHNPAGLRYPLVWEDNSINLTTEWEGGSETLAYVTGNETFSNQVWPSGDVVKIWDIFIPANARVGVLVEDLSGNLDLGIELFDSNGATYYASRGGGVASANAYGTGGNESMYWVNGPASDWVGLVVYNRNTAGGNYRIRISDAAAVDVAIDTPKTLQFAAAPNPWRQQATLRLALPVEADARIDVIDLQGRLVRQVHRGTLPAGQHEIRWDGRDSAGNLVAPGIYLARLRANDENRLLKLVRAN